MNVTYTPPPTVEGKVVVEMTEREAIALRILLGAFGLAQVRAALSAYPSYRLAEANNITPHIAREAGAAFYNATREALSDVFQDIR